MKELKVFISHSYFSDEHLVNGLYDTFTEYGFISYDHSIITKRLKPIITGGSDWDDLVRAYRIGGRAAPTQEQSDANLHEFLFEEIAKQDIIVIIWSELYAQKFWTQRELKTALSIGIQLIIIVIDNFHLDDEIERAVNSGNAPLFHFNNDYNPIEICKSIVKLPKLKLDQQPPTIHDEGLKLNFLKIHHPVLGAYEILQSFITWADIERLGIIKPPIKYQDGSIGGNCSYKHLKEYCHFLNINSPIYHYRLPTESEWEFAARSGNQSIRNWTSELTILEDQPTIQNKWGMNYDSKAYEWTSTHSEWQEYLGWVRPIAVKGKEFGPNRALVVKSLNSGIGSSGGLNYPKLMYNFSQELWLGFRLIRELRKDINPDQVFRNRHKNIALELLSIKTTEEFQFTVKKLIRLGKVTRYFRGYLEQCIIDNSLAQAYTLLENMLEVEYVPPPSLPSYLFNYYSVNLEEVFKIEDPVSSFIILLNKLEKKKLLGWEFAEVYFYFFFKAHKVKTRSLIHESCLSECLKRLDPNKKTILFAYN